MSIWGKLHQHLVTSAAGVAVLGGVYAGVTVVVGWFAGMKPFEKAVTETRGTMSSNLEKISGDVNEIKKAATEAKKGGWFNLLASVVAFCAQIAIIQRKPFNEQFG